MLKINTALDKCRHLRDMQRWQRCTHTKSSASDVKSEENFFKWQKPLGQFTGIRIYNHQLRSKVPLVLRNPQMVTWYTCGPTVYDSTHLGHASTYVKVDIIQRILRDYFKLNLVTAMNITDVDDKIIKRSKECNRSMLELTRAYTSEFQLDMQRLNVMPPDLLAHVSSNILNIQRFIEQLINSKQAYVAQDKSVYFDVANCKSYGKLTDVSLDDVQPEEQQQLQHKRHPADFALWKAKKEQYDPSWLAPWGGEGRPGWHIECSAIASMCFGSKLDFHAGGLDLRFPHHENEEAQCCAHHEQEQWVNYWLHTGQLHLTGEQQKMSKSLGNTISVTQLLEDYSADEFRMACLLSNYRNAMPYSKELMQTACQTLQKFHNFQADLQAYMQFLKPLKLLDEGALVEQLQHMTAEFDNSLRDDFDTARAIGVLMDQMSSISRCIDDQQPDAEEQPAHCLDLLLAAGNFIQKSMRIFGLSQLGAGIQTQAASADSEGINANALIADILALRSKLREQAVNGNLKNMALLAACDEMRNLLQQHGVKVRDHKQGSSWIYNAGRKIREAAKKVVN
ncbi:probable cysteine--tRNA ligase, mitochondrial isoform X2 [Drosophila busckii]|uniref:probable cysteine--tRNA ligase, mitochondrial isoform X2 n=1 Tax=Drosophila busckii TaxID=30019 RepID=UPI00083EA95C|nr:probable cysteine--tRNA ligase, mitochondrial isoform X2 [Drosophila busckii]